MNGDASIISGISIASSRSSSSRRFKLFAGLGKRRKKKPVVSELPPPPASEALMDYGYGGDEQAPPPYKPELPRFEPVLEDDDASEDSPHRTSSKHRNTSGSDDDASGIDSASSSSSSEYETRSFPGMQEFQSTKLAAPIALRKSNPQSAFGSKQQQRTTPKASNYFSNEPPTMEPRRNLLILIPRLKKRKPPTPYSILTRTKFFQSLIDNAFDAIDTDHVGHVDEKQLYSGLLLIHLKLGMVAGPAACRPLPRERSKAIFDAFDIDEHGYLNREEFGKIMVLMFSNVLFRVVLQWSMTILIVPVVAKEVLDRLSCVYRTTMRLEKQVWVLGLPFRMMAWVFGRCFALLPASVMEFLQATNDLTHVVPGRIWNALPLTVLSTLLGLLIVPLLVFKVDSLTQFLADRRHTKKMRKKIEAGDIKGS
jgi:hypothetical protein